MRSKMSAAAAALAEAPVVAPAGGRGMMHSVLGESLPDAGGH